MSTKLIIGVVALVALALGAFLFLDEKNTEINNVPNPTQTPQAQQSQAENVNYQASFAIFTSGTFRIFTDPRYHNKSEDVFIEATNPNKIQVKKAGVTWNDFFQTLPMKLEKTCLTTGTGQVFCTNENAKLRFYINGQVDENALDKEIKEGDKLLVSYSANENQLQQELEKIPN